MEPLLEKSRKSQHQHCNSIKTNKPLSFFRCDWTNVHLVDFLLGLHYGSRRFYCETCAFKVWNVLVIIAPSSCLWLDAFLLCRKINFPTSANIKKPEVSSDTSIWFIRIQWRSISHLVDTWFQRKTWCSFSLKCSKKRPVRLRFLRQINVFKVAMGDVYPKSQRGSNSSP